MKILLPFLLASSLCASDWTTEDTQRQFIVLGITTIDWAQTRQLGDTRCIYHENNKLMGHGKPSPGRINRWFIGGAVLHTGIAYLLPPEMRKKFQHISIGWEAGFVAHNYKLGVRIKL